MKSLALYTNHLASTNANLKPLYQSRDTYSTKRHFEQRAKILDLFCQCTMFISYFYFFLFTPSYIFYYSCLFFARLDSSWLFRDLTINLFLPLFASPNVLLYLALSSFSVFFPLFLHIHALYFSSYLVWALFGSFGLFSLLRAFTWLFLTNFCIYLPFLTIIIIYFPILILRKKKLEKLFYGTFYISNVGICRANNN